MKVCLAPQLGDGNFATLHHLGQNARGPLAEASARSSKRYLEPFTFLLAIEKQGEQALIFFAGRFDLFHNPEVANQHHRA